MKRKILLWLLALILLAACVVLSINGWVRSTAKPHISDTPPQPADCILVLGCGVREDGQPSLMLRDRLEKGLELYESGAAPKLLMSGDHSRQNYDEVNAMKDYAMAAGIPSEDIFMDHAGFSTYESMYRARDVFQAKRIIIVSQGYHLYRAVYDARALGLEAWGVPAADVAYMGQFLRDIREILARNKDFFYCLIQPEPTFLGDPIPITANGDLTNDRSI